MRAHCDEELWEVTRCICRATMHLQRDCLARIPAAQLRTEKSGPSPEKALEAIERRRPRSHCHLFHITQHGKLLPKAAVALQSEQDRGGLKLLRDVACRGCVIILEATGHCNQANMMLFAMVGR